MSGRHCCFAKSKARQNISCSQRWHRMEEDVAHVLLEVQWQPFRPPRLTQHTYQCLELLKRIKRRDGKRWKVLCVSTFSNSMISSMEMMMDANDDMMCMEHVEAGAGWDDTKWEECPRPRQLLHGAWVFCISIYYYYIFSNVVSHLEWEETRRISDLHVFMVAVLVDIRSNQSELLYVNRRYIILTDSNS